MPAVASRRLPCGSRRGRWRHARGKSANNTSGGGCASGCGSGPPRRLSRRVPEGGDRSELRAWSRETGSFGRVSRAEPGGHRSGRWAHLPTRGRGGLRASSRELRRPGTRGCTGGACLASGRSPKRAAAGRRWPKPKAAFARPSGRLTERGRHPEVEARIREGGSRGCLPGGHRPRPVAPRKTRSGTSDDTFPGVRSLSANSARAIVGVPVCLTDTVRPQGFSPSRRFDPARALWVCFAPHPPIGFRSSELFPRGQPQRLSALDALLPLG